MYNGNFPESLALGGAPDPLCQALAWTLGHSSEDERPHPCPPGKAGKKSVRTAICIQPGYGAQHLFHWGQWERGDSGH